MESSLKGVVQHMKIQVFAVTSRTLVVTASEAGQKDRLTHDDFCCNTLVFARIEQTRFNMLRELQSFSWDRARLAVSPCFQFLY